MDILAFYSISITAILLALPFIIVMYDDEDYMPLMIYIVSQVILAPIVANVVYKMLSRTV